MAAIIFLFLNVLSDVVFDARVINRMSIILFSNWTALDRSSRCVYIVITLYFRRVADYRRYTICVSSVWRMRLTSFVFAFRDPIHGTLLGSIIYNIFFIHNTHFVFSTTPLAVPLHAAVVATYKPFGVVTGICVSRNEYIFNELPATLFPIRCLISHDLCKPISDAQGWQYTVVFSIYCVVKCYYHYHYYLLLLWEP